MRRLGTASLFACVALTGGGCQRAESEVSTRSEVEAPKASVGSGDGGVSAMVAAAQRPDVHQLSVRLGEVVPIEPLKRAPTTTPIVWGPPSCPLRYRFVADMTMELLDEGGDRGPMSQSGLRMSGGFTLRAGEDDSTIIRNGEIEIAHVTAGVKRPAPAEPAGALAEVRLRRDGLQWREVDGPTGLWSAYGSFPGLVGFWPALPASPAAGSKADWALTMHRRGDGIRTEVERGGRTVPEGFEFPTPTPRTLDAEVVVQGWVEVSGQPAVVLVSTWTHDSTETLRAPTPPSLGGVEGPSTEVSERSQSRSRYVVLASGRLLWADQHRITHVEMSMGSEHTMRQRHDLRATAALVEACDGPVLRDVVPEPSFEEAALEAVVLLRTAAVAKDAALMKDHLAPELVAAHGPGEVTRVLGEHVERFGGLSLGIVEMADRVERDGDRVRIEMTGRLQRSADDDESVRIVVEVERQDGRPRITSIHTNPAGRDEGGSILEVSTSRLRSAG